MKRVPASDFPALRQFFGGYLHEDFVEEHDTPARRAEDVRSGCR
jgi:hypothetical protein